MQRIYLDNAATSWPKPESVYRAVDDCQRRLGVATGRGVYAEAMEVDAAISATRQAITRLIGAADRRSVIFTYSGTDSLNLAIHGSVVRGGHVVTTVVEHNSVLRPLRALEECGAVQVTRVGCNSQGIVDPDDIRAALRPDTCLVAMSHASNVTGALQPIADVGELTRAHGALFLVDAAQSLGEIPLDVSRTPIDLLAAPGHKGLLGPLGTGVLWLRPGIEDRVNPLRLGGTGTQSDEDRQPSALPAKYEAGNLNAPGIVGLGAGVAYLLEQKVERLRAEAIRSTGRLLDGLRGVFGVTIVGPHSVEDRVGVVSVTVDGYDPQEVAASLETAFRVQVRSGLHCAPRMHAALGTLRQGGTVRLSLGPFTTEAEIDAAVDAIRQLARAG